MLISNSSTDYRLRIALIGESGVGKTNLISTFHELDPNREQYNDLEEKLIEIDGKRVKLLTFDSSGRNLHKIDTSFLIRKMRGVILVYDPTKIDTFNTLQKWMKIIIENSMAETVVILVAHQ